LRRALAEPRHQRSGPVDQFFAAGRVALGDFD
jgi:hypothetical protein